MRDALSLAHESSFSDFDVDLFDAMFAADIVRTSSTKGDHNNGVCQGDTGSGGLYTGSTLPAAVVKDIHQLAEEVRVLFAASSLSAHPTTAASGAYPPLSDS